MAIGSISITPVSASVAITVQNGTIQSVMALSFYQNMTQLPTKTSTVDGASDSTLMNSFSNALSQTKPSPKLMQVTVRVVSAPEWLNLTATMNLSDIATVQGDIMNASVAWKAFHVDTDLQADSINYNQVGKHYLRPVYDYYVNASRFVGRPNAAISGVTFFANQTSVGGFQAANQAGNVTLFDFRSLNATLEQWKYNYNLENDTSTWRYSSPPIIVASIKYAKGANLTSTIFSNYKYDSEIIVRGLARSKGNFLIVDVGGGRTELIMAALVIISIVAAIWTQVNYRKRRKKAILGRR